MLSDVEKEKRRNMTPEEVEEHKKLTSKATLAFYKKKTTWRKEIARIHSRTQSEIWYKFNANITPERRAELSKMSSDRLKKMWANLKGDEQKKLINSFVYGKDVEVIEKDRINTYSGILTESQLMELLNEA